MPNRQQIRYLGSKIGGKFRAKDEKIFVRW